MVTTTCAAFSVKLPERPKFTRKMQETNMWITQFKWYWSAAGLDHKKADSVAVMNIAAAYFKGSAA